MYTTEVFKENEGSAEQEQSIVAIWIIVMCDQLYIKCPYGHENRGSFFNNKQIINVTTIYHSAFTLAALSDLSDVHECWSITKSSY